MKKKDFAFNSVVIAITNLIGTEGYELIEDELEYLMMKHKFDEAAKFVKDSNLIKDEDNLKRIIFHIESFKYAC